MDASQTPEIDAALTRPVDRDALDAVERAIDASDPGAALVAVGRLLRAFDGFARSAGREAANVPTNGLLGRVAARARDLVVLVWDLDDCYRALYAQPSAATLERAADAVAGVLCGHSLMVSAFRG